MATRSRTGTDHAAPASRAGQLFVVATPIGNLHDITERARRVLCEVALVAAEDTRHSRKLLQHVGSGARCISLHRHNEKSRIEDIVATLQGGDSVALVSDAGTPLISDPGYLLVRAVQQAGFATVPVPGPSAITAALSVAGVPTERFCFEGFLPARDNARRERLRELRHEQRTLVFFEAPHRILAMLQCLCDEFGAERPVTLARELTKQFETVLHGDVQTMLTRLREDADQQKGEFVIVAGGAAHTQSLGHSAENLLRTLLEELPPAKAARVAAKLTGDSKKSLYRLAVQLAERTKGDKDESGSE